LPVTPNKQKQKRESFGNFATGKLAPYQKYQSTIPINEASITGQVVVLIKKVWNRLKAAVFA